MDNIILIGFMGSGKSAVGQQLAVKMGYDFKDTDEIIVASEGIEIQEIFRKYGEEQFRNMESSLLLSLVDSLKNTILSTGGGMPIRDRNVNLLRLMGQVIYLRASQNTIIERLSGDTTRPLLEGENLEERVERLLGVRASIYEHAADLIIDTDYMSIDDIVDLIMRRGIFRG